MGPEGPKGPFWASWPAWAGLAGPGPGKGPNRPIWAYSGPIWAQKGHFGLPGPDLGLRPAWLGQPGWDPDLGPFWGPFWEPPGRVHRSWIPGRAQIRAQKGPQKGPKSGSWASPAGQAGQGPDLSFLDMDLALPGWLAGQAGPGPRIVLFGHGSGPWPARLAQGRICPFWTWIWPFRALASQAGRRTSFWPETGPVSCRKNRDSWAQIRPGNGLFWPLSGQDPAQESLFFRQETGQILAPATTNARARARVRARWVLTRARARGKREDPWEPVGAPRRLDIRYGSWNPGFPGWLASQAG